MSSSTNGIMPLVTWYSSTHERTARDTGEEAMGWHSALGTEEIGCSKWQWHKRLGASASQESSRTLKTPAASSPIVVNTVAVCCDSSVATCLSCSQDPLWQLLFSTGSWWARQLEEAGEERWKRD